MSSFQRFAIVEATAQCWGPFFSLAAVRAHSLLPLHTQRARRNLALSAFASAARVAFSAALALSAAFFAMRFNSLAPQQLFEVNLHA